MIDSMAEPVLHLERTRVSAHLGCGESELSDIMIGRVCVVATEDDFETIPIIEVVMIIIIDRNLRNAKLNTITISFSPFWNSTDVANGVCLLDNVVVRVAHGDLLPLIIVDDVELHGPVVDIAGFYDAGATISLSRFIHYPASLMLVEILSLFRSERLAAKCFHVFVPLPAHACQTSFRYWRQLAELTLDSS
jgi:hypothetical protein